MGLENFQCMADYKLSGIFCCLNKKLEFEFTIIMEDENSSVTGLCGHHMEM